MTRSVAQITFITRNEIKLDPSHQGRVGGLTKNNATQGWINTTNIVQHMKQLTEDTLSHAEERNRAPNTKIHHHAKTTHHLSSASTCTIIQASAIMLAPSTTLDTNQERRFVPEQAQPDETKYHALSLSLHRNSVCTFR